VYYIEAREEETEDPHTVVSGTFLVNTLPTRVLFDAGASHSLINLAIIEKDLPTN